MRIGYVQFSPVLAEPEANRRAVERLVALGSGAHLLVLPELCNSGYNFATRESALAAAEPFADSPFLRLLADLSRRHGVYLVGGFCEREGDRLYNTAALVGPEGPIGRYRKTHLFWNEKDLFQPGDLGFPVYDLDLGLLSRPGAKGRCRVGLLICFDWQFPEVWRILALRGVQIACHPSNLVLPGKAQRAVPLHAMLNRMFVVTTNRTGREGNLSFTGCSIIVSPEGEVLSQGGAAEDEVRTVEVDPAQANNKAVTPRNDLLADRRPELYTDLIRSPEELWRENR
jgi:predicted amidohydrolase